MFEVFWLLFLAEEQKKMCVFKKIKVKKNKLLDTIRCVFVCGNNGNFVWKSNLCRFFLSIAIVVGEKKKIKNRNFIFISWLFFFLLQFYFVNFVTESFVQLICQYCLQPSLFRSSSSGKILDQNLCYLLTANF